MRDAFIRALAEMAEADRRVLLVTGDLGFGVFDQYRRRFPGQFLNAGVAEQNMTMVATGLALEGRVVFTYSIANFPTLRCLEQIRSDAAYHQANLKVVAIGGGFSYGALGISHHATEDLAILRALPGITVLAPGDLWEAEQATRVLAATPGTAYLRLDKSHARTGPGPGEAFRVGHARRLREGGDCTLVACGGILGEALEAADLLARERIQCRVLSMHTIKPLDTAALADAAQDTAGLLTVEEHTVIGGLGGAVAEELLEAGIHPGFFRRLGLRAGFSSLVGSQQYLRGCYGLDANAIAAAVRTAVNTRYQHATQTMV